MNMNSKLKKNIEEVINKFPNSKLLFALTVAIILSVILYIVILFFLSR